MTDKLTLFNDALLEIGERPLASLTENRESRRTLDRLWANNQVMNFCLEQGLWNFAFRTVELPPSPSVTPGFGYTYAYEQPEDFIRTARFCTDDYLRYPLKDYLVSNGYWYASINPVYVQYVSKADDTGYDLSLWPESFTRYVTYYLARRLAPRITENQSRIDNIERELRKALVVARSRDAMEEPTQKLPQGTWVRSRFGDQTRIRRGGLEQ